MSEALRLAALLDAAHFAGENEAATELRRLHALVEEDSILQRRQRDEIAQLGQALARAIERINELETELHEQARLVGMGSEREARLMALNAELVEALHQIRAHTLYSPTGAVHLIARAALAKVET